MQHRPRRPALATAALLALLALARPATLRAQDPEAPPPAAAEEPQETLGRHAAAWPGIYQVIQDVVGPLPSIASTPFFGLAALSGLALLSDSAWMREARNPVLRGVRDNVLIREARSYASPPVFFALLALAVLTWLANSGKIRGAFGKLLRGLEDSSTLLAYTLLVVAALAHLRGSPPARLVTAGLGDTSAAALFAVAVAVGLAAMMAVRFALDVLIWLSPVPLVDFAFETLKKLLSALFILLYVIWPNVATVIALALLGASLLSFGWATRLSRFLFGTVLRPMVERLLGLEPPALVDEQLTRGLELGGARPRLAVPATALRLGGVPKRQRGALVADDQGVWFVSRRWLRRPRRQPLGGDGTTPVLAGTLLWLELRVLTGDGASRARLALSRSLDPRAAELRRALGAGDGGRGQPSTLRPPALGAPTPSNA